MTNYLYPLATFIGTIIGVGFFGLPYVAARVGFFPVIIILCCLTIITIIIHLMFGEIALRTKARHRLPGYAEIYLNRRAKYLTVASNLIGLYGANLAYLVVGGGFLSNLLSPFFGGSLMAYTVIFFAIGTLIVFFDSQSIARSELAAMIIFVFMLLLIFGAAWNHIDISHYLTYDLNLNNLLLPYGIILFSLSGMSIIPEIREMLDQKEKKLQLIISSGIIFSAFAYFIFIFTVLGVTGPNTTESALDGLKNILGGNILRIGFIVGLIATMTSFIPTTQTLKKIFQYDLKLQKTAAWSLACLIPLLLYLLGLNNFIFIISFTGAITLGIDSIIVTLIYIKAKTKGNRQPEYDLNIPPVFIYFITAMFLAGVVLEIANIIK
jgi:amino acid permease